MRNLRGLDRLVGLGSREFSFKPFPEPRTESYRELKAPFVSDQHDDVMRAVQQSSTVPALRDMSFDIPSNFRLRSPEDQQ